MNQNIPVFILAGGMGTRISEETSIKPKPMIEVGGIPILLHLMRSYYSYGFNDFVICAGYKAWDIKKFFMTYDLQMNHLEIDHRSGGSRKIDEYGNHEYKVFGDNPQQENWRVRVIGTGLNTMTGGRVARAFDEVYKNEKFDDFAVTYGDGLCDVNIQNEFNFHKETNKIGTVLGVKNIARFGELDVGENNQLNGFVEKPESKQGFINGGFFLFKSSFRDYLSTDESTILERGPIEKLTKDNELMVYKHEGFWQCMDTLRDKIYLQELWDTNKAPWKASRN